MLPADEVLESLLGLSGRHLLAIGRGRENANELDRDESHQDQQIDPQSPKCDPDSSVHFDPWHSLTSCPSNESLHDVSIMYNPEQTIMFVHDGD
jgi:hypothetical protein